MNAKKMILSAWLGALLCAGCASIEHSPSPRTSCSEKWVVLPMNNYTETPHAARSAEKLVENALRSRGLQELYAYPPAMEDSLNEFAADHGHWERALDWARGQNARYGVTGSVTEWRYKAGMDGEPAVGMTVQIVDIESGKGIWSAGGSLAGWSRGTISGIAQKLIVKLLRKASLSC
jgi:polysaccharide biosynthesis protein PelC